ncbi:hypothetical protein CROQUDRAFT_660729 [Cronartium quercuum f. sp. fusiforme G11]|uniref:Uncharacterized protein n=1 Tax=Cronartium quercuum f. sp. fusiforme G11 TaxID=708437 RepID=A0A9P6NGM2_9BASI|nr:hypothetical protein CROQUDRAFT_660729 [Cronartium quercuum f. sp. fusiforme G11]
MNSGTLTFSLVLVISVIALQFAAPSSFNCPHSRGIGICGNIPDARRVVSGAVSARKIHTTYTCDRSFKPNRACCPKNVDPSTHRALKCVSSISVPKLPHQFTCDSGTPYPVCGRGSLGTVNDAVDGNSVIITYSCDGQKKPAESCCTTQNYLQDPQGCYPP